MAYPRPPAWSVQLPAVGVTGTNGKTSTTLLLAAALGPPGHPVPAMTTLGFEARGRRHAPKRYADYVAALRGEYEAGARRCVVEMTSLALARGVARSWPLAGGVFTNLSRDHFDLHGSWEHYLASKAQLFVCLPQGAFAVVNADDEVAELVEEVMPDGVEVRRFGRSSRATDRVVSVDVTWSGTRVTMADDSVVETPLVGEHFGLNAVAAWVAARAWGVSAASAAAGLASLPRVPGRFERVAKSPHVVVDFAHAPDALSKTIATARSLAGGARVLVVFGAAGGTDPTNRPELGRASCAADRVFVTNDNPRDEAPDAIAAEVLRGVDRDDVVVELDRGRAIAAALDEAGPNDLVILAGKGHERGQLVRGEVKPWSDHDFVRAHLATRG